MALILLILGIVLAGAGLAMIGYAIPISDTTLLAGGSPLVAGGAILVGLSALLAEFARVTEGLKARAPARAAPEPAAHGPTAMAYPASPAPAQAPAPAALAPPPPSPRAAPAAPPVPPMVRRPEAPVRPSEHHPPQQPSSVEVSSAAIERLRSSIPRGERPRAEPAAPQPEYDEVPLSPNGAGAASRSRAVEPPEPHDAAEERGGAGDQTKKSRLDFLFRAKSPARPGSAAPAENFETVWPTEGRQAEPPTRQEPPPPEPRAPEPRNAAILKSGVVDGMAYTLYADGSIEAKLPQGTVRFNSIAELRSHIEHNS